MGVLAAQVAAREEMLARLRRSLQAGSALPPFVAVTAPPEPPAADRQQMLHASGCPAGSPCQADNSTAPQHLADQSRLYSPANQM